MAKETIKIKQIPLDEMIEIVEGQVIDAHESQKYKRTAKSKRDNKKVIRFFTSCLYYLNELKIKES